MKNFTEVTPVPGHLQLSVPTFIKKIRYLYLGEVTNPIKHFNDFIGTYHTKINFSLISSTEFFYRSHKYTTEFSRNIHFKKDGVYTLKKILFLKFGIGIEKINDSCFEIFCTTNYFRWLPERIGNLCPVGIHIFNLFFIQSILHNALILYGGCFLNLEKKEAAMVIAPSGVGKTRTLLACLKEKKYQLLAEEVSYSKKVDNTYIVYTTPYTSVTNLEKHGFLGFLNGIWGGRMKSLFEILGTSSFAQQGILKRIYVLEKSPKNEISKMSFDDAFKKISILQNIFSYSSDLLLQAGAYADIFDLLTVESQKNLLMRDLLASCEIYKVCGVNSEDFFPLIQTIEQ